MRTFRNDPMSSPYTPQIAATIAAMVRGKLDGGYRGTV
jgi:hypothetical protein